MNQRNYQKELDQLLVKIDNEPKKTLFLHCCCAPCSSYVTEYLSAHFHLVLFFYNPNITEKDEYEKRKQELLRLISEKEYPGKIDIVEADYDSESFYEMAKGYEKEPECGKRCFLCYELRLRETAKEAVRYGADYFCTTLSISPHKNAGKLMSGISDGVIDGVSGMAAGIPGFFMKLLIAVIATVFMELEFPEIKAFLKRQIPAEYQRAFRDGKNYVTGTMGKCILSYCLIFGITFAELTAGLFLLGIKNAFAIAFIIAVLDILPVLGTGTVLIPWAVLAFASGRISAGVGVFGLYLVITVVRNLIEPKLVGKQMGLSPVIMLPCMLIGLKFFGIIGLFVVPLLVSFLKQLNDRGIIKMFR